MSPFESPIGFRLMQFAPIIMMVLVMLAFLLPRLLSNAATARRNSAEPVQQREAYVVSRRQEVWGRQRTRTNYYLTFQFRDGSRQEYAVEGSQFGLLAEGDTGILASQGTWFKGFERKDL